MSAQFRFTKLEIGKIEDKSRVFKQSFYCRGFDIEGLGDDYPQFRLYFSNNPDELKEILNNKSENSGSPVFIDFKVDPDTNSSYFVPERKKKIPSFKYTLLVSTFKVKPKNADMFFEDCL